MDVNQALEKARTPGPMMCPVSGERLYAPMDKLCIALYGHSTHELDEEKEQYKINNLFKIIEGL